jgi:phosphate starvation-inducible PhoH-like protein
MQWKIIGNKVTQISNTAIDKVLELQNKRTAKEEMARYIEPLCNPDIDTVVCQGVAGSGKTFTAMLCAFMALKEGLLEEILHTRPLVSAGGVGIGYEPGFVGQKLVFWSKPMTDAFNRLNLDEELKSKVNAYPFDRVRGISMRPRT